MAWRVEDSAEAKADLFGIFEHLYASRRAFGYSEEEAVASAEARLAQIGEGRLSLARTPHIGTRHGDRLRGLRHVTLGRAIYWFVLDEPAETVRLVGVFYGGQDHVGRVMDRLTGEGPS